MHISSDCKVHKLKPCGCIYTQLRQFPFRFPHVIVSSVMPRKVPDSREILSKPFRCCPMFSQAVNNCTKAEVVFLYAVHARSADLIIDAKDSLLARSALS